MQEQTNEVLKTGGEFITSGVTNGNKQFLTFELNGEPYGIDILDIKEIIEQCHVTKVPMTPKFLAGVINLRGNVVPVVDLAQRFSQESSAITKKNGIVILDIAGSDGRSLEIGITVDLVNEVKDLRENDIQAAPSFGTTIRADFISGIVKLDGRLLILLSMDRIISIDELSVIE